MYFSKIPAEKDFSIQVVLILFCMKKMAVQKSPCLLLSWMGKNIELMKTEKDVIKQKNEYANHTFLNFFVFQIPTQGAITISRIS